MPLSLPGPLLTERLVVRAVCEADLPDLLAVNGDDEVTAFLPYTSWRSLDDGRAWYARMAAIQAAGDALQLVAALRGGGAVVGTCLLFHIDESNARAEIGYVLGREHWGTGLMREALTALLGACFGELGLRRIEAEVDPRNLASSGLLGRLGFVREGLARQRFLTQDGPRDVALYGLLRHEWPVAGMSAD